MATAPKMTIVVIMSAAPIEMAISSLIVDPSDCRRGIPAIVDPLPGRLSRPSPLGAAGWLRWRAAMAERPSMQA
jgi:hypothetical protein